MSTDPVVPAPFTPTSAAQVEAWETRILPPVERVRDDVWSVPVPLPVGGGMPWTNCYVLRASDGGIHLVDPGWDSDENWRIVCDALEAVGSTSNDVQTVVSTHLHADHLGLAERFRLGSGATLVMHPAEALALADEQAGHWRQSLVSEHIVTWGVPDDRLPELLALADVPPTRVDVPFEGVPVEDGTVLDAPGIRLRAVHTPGHTPGHLCLHDVDRSLLFTGDHLRPTVFSGIGLGGPTKSNPLGDYLASLGRVAELDGPAANGAPTPVLEALPGHGWRFTGIGDRAGATAAHHLRRTSEVAAALASDPALSVWEIASRLTWTAGWGGLRDFTLYSALTQTAMHRDFVSAGSSREG